MKNKNRNEVITHYNELFEKFGIDPASLGEPKGRTKLRFDVMTKIGNLNNCKILDVGCGFGYLVTYLKKYKKNIKYTGVEINSDFIKIAKKMHPNHRFQERDIEKKKFKEKFDWVFGIGLASKVDSYSYLESILKEMINISNKGVVMNFITDYVDFKNKGTFYTSPEKIFKIAKKFSKRVVLRHDYLPFEFCIYIYKEDEIDKKDSSFKKFPSKKQFS